MPFNLLLLPLIAGFLFITRNHLFSYSTSTLSKESLLLHASLAGLCFLLASRIICWGLLQSDAGLAIAEGLHAIAPFPFIGTAAGALLLAITASALLNLTIPAETAGRWCYHGNRFNGLESLLLRSAIGVPASGLVSGRIRLVAGEIASRWLRLKRFACRLPDNGHPELLMLTLGDNKVYIGFVVNLPPLHTDGFQFVRLLPIWSGYRDETRQVSITTSYPMDGLADPEQKMTKLIPLKEISSANLYVEGVFPIPGQIQPSVGPA